MEKGFVGFNKGYFKWDEDFLHDLLALKSIAVRGYITAYNEKGKYYKYVFNNKSIKEYYGSVKFPKKLARVIASGSKTKKSKL